MKFIELFVFDWELVSEQLKISILAILSIWLNQEHAIWLKQEPYEIDSSGHLGDNC